MLIDINYLTKIYSFILLALLSIDILVVYFNIDKKKIILDRYYALSVKKGVLLSTIAKAILFITAVILLREPSVGIRVWPIIIILYGITILRMFIAAIRSRNK